jgi:two-component system C4-dicarboxylate transport response regulator DctD
MRQGYGILINTITGTYMIMGRILIVEHEEHVRRTVGLVLRQGGYEVIEVMDGEQAIQTIQAETQNQAVTAIICDLGLPKSSGKEVIAFIRAKLPSVPIIVLTGHPDVQAAASLFTQGVVDYLVKPAQAQTLLDSVRRAINEQALSG